jgi:RNA polymerase sigma factor (sigma-70 family)
MIIKELFTRKQQGYCDMEVILCLQRRERKAEEWFYKTAKRYFDEHFNEVFFDKDKKQEIFQSAFLKLWMEIDNKRICIEQERVCRRQQSGEVKPMTCSLTTFLMAFAKTEYRELARSTKEDYFGELFDDAEKADIQVTDIDKAEDTEEQKNRIVDECISHLSPNCAEILTLFYYKEMSLDEILEQRADQNTSKNGLKTAKNKCMNTLRDRITVQFEKYHLTA